MSVHALPQTKVCTKCKKRKSRDKFYAAVKAKDGLASWCKHCFNRRFSKEQVDENNLKYKYGLTMQDYAQILVKQGGGCMICEEPPPDGRRLCVDHNHKTGRVRALLCDSCNRRLGIFEANREVFEAYLSFFEGE